MRMNAGRIPMAALAALFAAGCSDPAGGVLGPGAEAVVVLDEPDGEDRWTFAPGIGKLDAGVKVRVVDDPGPADRPRRMVRIRVLEGPEEGDVGETPRRNLRPL